MHVYSHNFCRCTDLCTFLRIKLLFSRNDLTLTNMCTHTHIHITPHHRRYNYEYMVVYVCPFLSAHHFPLFLILHAESKLSFQLSKLLQLQGSPSKSETNFQKRIMIKKINVFCDNNVFWIRFYITHRAPVLS